MATFAAALSGKRDYTLYLDVWESALDQANNRSQVSWSLHINKAYYYDTAWNKYHVCNYSVVINGSTVANASGVDYDFSSASTNVFSTGSTWVAHGADGLGSATVSGYFGGTSALGSATASGVINLSNLIQGPMSVTNATFTDNAIVKFVSWTNNVTSIKPYANIRVTRLVNGLVSRAWLLAGNATDLTDTDYVTGYVQYYIEAINGAGTTPKVYTTIEVGNPSSTLTVVADPGTARVTWVAPSITNGRTVQGYRIRYDKLYPSDSGTADVSAATLLYDTSIVAGQSVTFNVAALVDGSYGPYSNYSNQTVNTPNYPLAPGSIGVSAPVVTGSVAPRTSSVTVSWAPDSSADDHRVNVSPLGPTVTYGVNSATLDAMTPGTTYTLSVQAHNSYGWGAASGSVSVIAPNVPSQPTLSSLTSMVADGVPTIVLNYSVDNSSPANGYSPITDNLYKVTSATGTLVDWTSLPASPMEINDGVVPGTPYTVSLKSVNAVGESSVVSGTVTPIGGRIMVKNGATWTPTFIKAGVGFATNAQVRIFDGQRWGYSTV